MSKHEVGARGALATLLAVGACGGGLEPSEVAGTYLLAPIENAPPPYVVFAGDNCDWALAEGELVLDAAGTYTMEVRGPSTCPTGSEQGTMGRFYVGPYAIEGSRLEFRVPLHLSGELRFGGTLRDGIVAVEVPPFPQETGADTLAMTFRE